MEKIMKKVGVKLEDRSVVIPAREAEKDARRSKNEGKGYKDVYCGAAIEIYLDSGETMIVTGKNSPILYAESAAILNAVKILAKIPDGTDVISPNVIQSIIKMKNILMLNGSSLDIKEILDALASSAVSSENAQKCLEALKKLKNCEMHTTHIMNKGNEKALTQMGLIVTTDAKIPFLM